MFAASDRESPRNGTRPLPAGGKQTTPADSTKVNPLWQSVATSPTMQAGGASATRQPGVQVSEPGPANATPPGLMTASLWGCLFGQLGGCQPAEPTSEVTIDSLRTSGRTSDENTSELCPSDLGVLPGTGRNAMELRATVNGYVPGVEYDFKRTKKGRAFARIDGRWSSYVIVGTDDDAHNADESLTPVNGHIYAIDKPGASDPQKPTDPAATEFVQKLSMTEWVMVRKGPAEKWTHGSSDFYWHSVVWLRKVDGVWQTDEEKSEIGPGTIYVDTKEP